MAGAEEAQQRHSLGLLGAGERLLLWLKSGQVLAVPVAARAVDELLQADAG